MKVIDKIIVSPTAPKNKNAAWFDGKSIKMPSQGEWKSAGGSGESPASLMINVTYEELVKLRNEGKLTPGVKYRMTDYETMTSKEGTKSAGHPFDLVLTALDNKTLDERCSAINSERDTEGYFANQNLGAWEIYYCLDNDSSRFNWAAVKGVIWSAEGMSITLEDYGAYTWNGAEYYAYRFDYGSMTEAGVVAYVYALYPTSVPQVGDVATYVLLDGTSLGAGIQDMTSDLNLPISSVSTISGKGVIYRMIDNRNNIDIYYDFKNIMFKLGNTDNYFYTIGSKANQDSSLLMNGVKITPFVKYTDAGNNTCIYILGKYQLDPRHFDGATMNNITIVNCPLILLYTQEGEMTNLYFENCEIECTHTGNNFFRYMKDSSFKNIVGTLDFVPSANKYNNIDADGALPLSGVYDGSVKTYIRKKSNGSALIFNIDDLSAAINK